MKKVFMSLLFTAGISGMVLAQATQSQSTQSQSSTSSSMQSDKDSKDGWQKIGEKSIDFSKDKEELSFNTNDKFTAIKFKAKDGTVNLSNVELQYEDDSKQTVNLESPIKAESESKVVSLSNTDKKLDKVTFNYKKDASGMAAGRSDKAKVEVWGLKDKSGSGMGSRSSGSQSGTGMDRSSSDTSMYDHSTTTPDHSTTPGTSGSSRSGQGSQSGSQYGTTPGSTTPGSTTPGSTTPGSTTPGSTTPGSTTPGSTTPGSTTPGSTTPGSTTPGSSGTTR